jgi:lipoprotein-releasing system permease protein
VSLIVEIALTHIFYRVRQTLVAVAGVATGVGFSIMMAALMEGSQEDFMRLLIDAVPHITVSDERRQAPLQPAETAYEAAQIRGLTPDARRKGIKNPMAIMASLEAWVPGAVAPSTKTQAILRYAARDVGASIVGIDPHREPKVSMLATQMRIGTLASLYRASNAIVLGDRLAEKMGARIGSNISIQSSSGSHMGAQVVGLFRSGVRGIDESTGYVLIKTAQVLAQQTGLVNELRVRVSDIMAAQDVARRIEREAGYKSVSWQEAHEDLLSGFIVRNVLMYTIVGAILLVASFGTYNIISTITNEKTRDIAILKSLGVREAAVRLIFVLEGMTVGLIGALFGWALGYGLTAGLGTIEIKNPMIDATRLPLVYSTAHYAIASGAALASSLIAGYFPARKASRLHPVDIIRGAT